ncbi:hypothetical protein ACWD5R_43700 [Streptomyces sp. NPDC002514]
MHETSVSDFMAAEYTPKHCGRDARYVDSGIWECRRCDAYAVMEDDFAPPVWKNA